MRSRMYSGFVGGFRRRFSTYRQKPMESVIVSKTGIPRGKGSDRYKYVAYLTKEEKAAALRGETVLVECPWSQHCDATDYKLVVPFRTHNGRQKFGHRNYR